MPDGPRDTIFLYRRQRLLLITRRTLVRPYSRTRLRAINGFEFMSPLVELDVGLSVPIWRLWIPCLRASGMTIVFGRSVDIARFPRPPNHPLELKAVVIFGTKWR